MNEHDLVTIGDATWDVFIVPSEADTFCEVNTEKSMIAFKYGEKIPAKSLDFSIGGNAANNAVGTRRLGVKVAPILTLGDDNISNQIVETFIKEGVNTSYVYRQRGTATNYSTAIVVGGERTIFTYKQDKKHQFPEEFPVTNWIYLTSLGDDYTEIYKRVVEIVGKNSQIKLAFNPGTREIKAGVDAMSEVLAHCYAVYINRQEAEIITGQSESKSREKELLTALSKLGPRLPIVTDGANGAYVLSDGKFYHSGVLPIDAYERTGAGDSFGAGCVAALVKGKDIKEALLWGTVNSGSVIGYVGAQKGLLKEEQISEWLERAKSCNVTVEEF